MDGRYRITGVLGTGGMGCVYRAEHVAIRRPLALKLLHPEVEGIDGISERFQREAFAIGRVDHPNCVNVSDFGELEGGALYMVLEVLDGVPLFDLLEKEHRLGWRRSLHIARHVLSALAYAHEAGIVHRDVKPENVILVEQEGDPDFAKILDFGIAKLFDDAHIEAGSPGLTQLGVTIGTPTYIAPEQAFGQPVDARADLYALSVMLFEMVTGAPPFDADEVVALLSMHATSEVPRISEVAPRVRVPDEVEAMIRRGLEKKKEDRFQSASEYIAQIDEALTRDSLSPELTSLGAAPELPERLSWVEGVRIKAEDVRKTLAPVVARAVTEVQAIPKRRSRKEILAVGIGVIALFAVLLVAFGSSGPDYLPTRTHLPLVAPKHGPEAEAAAEMLEQGQPKEAAAYLRSQRSKVRKEPYAQLVLGHAHASAQRNIEALQAYSRAISLEPSLSKNKLLRTNLDLMLAKQDPRVIDEALDILGTLARDDGDAEEELVRLASSDGNLHTRQRAMAVADEVGLGDQIDRLNAYELDLQQGNSCADRRDAVAKLRALGDKRAIPALRQAQRRTRTEGLLKRKTNANACLRTDAEEAVQYLKSL
ncbi:MAG: protein kinase [Myxococcales bacterium]|nr:protein kinase [Myxococcales bacterium]